MRSPRLILGFILILFALLSITLSMSIPLGESPDEPAHFAYIQYITQQKRLPFTPEERIAAGYRSDYPATFQAIASLAGKLTQVEGPESLKNINDNPLYILALDGLSGLTTLHTDDEAFPYRGIVRFWHAGRLVSILFSVGSLLLIYLILQQQFSASISLIGVAIVAVVPQFLTISSVLNDDSLLGFWVALFLWLLWPLFKSDASWRRYLLLGLVAGAALATKYSALFMSFDLALLWLLLWRKPKLSQIFAFVFGAILSAGWWFAYIIYFFNQFEALGWFRGALAAFLLVEADSSSAQVAGMLGVGPKQGAIASLFSLDWLTWFKTLFITYWYPFIPPAVWWIPLLVLSLFIGGAIIWTGKNKTPLGKQMWFLAGHISLFMPLLLIRYILTENIAETAQGRHLLFPTLVPLAFFLVALVKRLPGRYTAWSVWGGLIAFLLLALFKVIWPVITWAEFRPLPVTTQLETPPQIKVANFQTDEVVLLGLNIPALQPKSQALPLELVWQALDRPSQDYSVRLTLLNEQNEAVGLWQGQPVNGYYPTRAWDKGDFVSHLVWIPAFSNSKPTALQIEWLDQNKAVVQQQIINSIEFPAVKSTSAGEPGVAPRSDRYPDEAPYRFRNSIAVIGSATPVLLDANGQAYTPTAILEGQTEQIAIFEVDWFWPSGEYTIADTPKSLTIKNNERLSQPPAISRPLSANFNNQFALLGYDLPTKQVQPGESFDITLYWQALAPDNVDYKVFNHLLDANHIQYGGQDRTPQTYYSTFLWQPGEAVVDSYVIPVSFNAPPGMYWLDVGLYPGNTATAMPLPLVVDGNVIDQNSVALGPIKVGGQPEISIPPQPPARPRSDNFGEQIQLDGYTYQLDSASEQLKLEFYWSARQDIPLDYTLFVHIVNSAGEVAAQGDGPPVNGLYLTSFWEPGETIFDPRSISLSNLPPGDYQIRLGWYNPATGERLPVSDNPDGYITLDTFPKNNGE